MFTTMPKRSQKQAFLEHHNQWRIQVFVSLATIIGQTELLLMRYEELLSEAQVKCVVELNRNTSLGITHWYELDYGIHQHTLSDEELEALYFSKMNDFVGRLLAIKGYCELLLNPEVGYLNTEQQHLVGEVLVTINEIYECYHSFADIVEI